MLGQRTPGTWVRNAGLVLLPVLTLGGCASSGGGGGGGDGPDLRGQPPQVAGQSFAFTGQARAQGRSSRIFEGEVRFLDGEWYIMEMWDRPCDTRVTRYLPVADEITVRCQETGVDLTFYLAEGRLMGRVEGPVMVRGQERVCDMRESVNTQVRCTKWSLVDTERAVRGKGEAEITRITGG